MTDSTTLIIRKFIEEDTEILLKLFKEAVAEINIRHYSEQQVTAWTAVELVEWQKTLKAHETFVAEIDGVIVGFADLRQDGYNASRF